MNDCIKGFKAKPEKIYKFECGNTSHAKRSWAKGKGRGKLVCPKCGAAVTGVPKICVACEKEFLGARFGHGQIRCPKCQTEHILAAAREKNRLLSKAKKKRVRKDYPRLGDPVKKAMILAVATERERTKNMKKDCVIFDHCIDWDLKKNKDACVGCIRYSPKSSLRYHGGEPYQKRIRIKERVLQKL